MINVSLLDNRLGFLLSGNTPNDLTFQDDTQGQVSLPLTKEILIEERNHKQPA